MASSLSVRTVTAAELVRQYPALQADVQGDATVSLSGVAPLSAAGEHELSFLVNPRYVAQVAQTKAGAVVLSPADYQNLPDAKTRTYIICAKPHVFFAFAAQFFARIETREPVRHPNAIVHETATIEKDVTIDAFAVIGAHSRVGSGAHIGPHVTIGDHCTIGAGTHVFPNVTIYSGCKIGARGIIHAGAVIGADGFGFANNDGVWVKIPQTGGVIIGDDCEIGANTTIDRGAMADTVIGEGVKIDNQVQIGHNVEIGAHAAIAGCVGIAGSARIGRGVQLGGAAMILGHLSIADGAVISAASTVTRSIDKAGFYTGIYPIDQNANWERSAALVRNLDKMRDRIRRLEALINKKDGETS
jgi:UDP-3-O-[3-hydroxymyristoyl] glucosamine N-acyltransferase